MKLPPRQDSLKWSAYPEDVLPLWVADMDFPVAEPIRKAIQARAEGFLGYPPREGDKELKALLLERTGLQGEVAFMPGVVVGLYAAVAAFTAPGHGVLTQVPVYPPFPLRHPGAGADPPGQPPEGNGGGLPPGPGGPGAPSLRQPPSPLLPSPEPHGSGLHRRGAFRPGPGGPQARPRCGLRRAPRPPHLREAPHPPGPLPSREDHHPPGPRQGLQPGGPAHGGGRGAQAPGGGPEAAPSPHLPQRPGHGRLEGGPSGGGRVA
jgi:hypothetical protein